MKTWSQFAEAEPVLSDFGKQRLEGRISYLATIRRDGSPRVHPVSPFIVGDHLFVYMEPTSPKRYDLLRDRRYAMHCAVEDNTGGQGEFVVSGEAMEIDDTRMREAAFEHAKSIGYNPQPRYVLFELKIGETMATVYDEDRIKRTRWKAI